MLNQAIVKAEKEHLSIDFVEKNDIEIGIY